MRIPLLSLFLVAMVLSGCLGIGLKDTIGGPAKRAGPVADVVAPQMLKVRDLLKNTTCEPSAAVGATSANLKPLGQYKPVGGSVALVGLGTPGTAYTQIDTYRNRTVILSPTGSTWTILNTTDPTRPVVWSTGSSALFQGGAITDPRFATPYTNAWDAVFSDDGSNVVAGVNNRIYASDATYRGFARVNYQGGFIDMPADYGGQAYRLAIEQIGNRQYVFVSPGPTSTGIAVFILAGSGYLAKFDSLGVMQFSGGQAGRVNIQPYDMVVKTERINDENRTLLYGANGPHGVVVLDVSQPLKPEIVTTIGATAAPGPTNLPGDYTSIATAIIDGKRIVAAAQTGPQSTLRLWDLTTIKTPKQIAAWTFDGQKPGQPQGELTFVNSTLFFTQFDQGLWGFDIAKLLGVPTGGLKPILHYQPPSGSAALDVSVEDGIIQIGDPLGQSLHLLGYGCFVPGERKYTSIE